VHAEDTQGPELLRQPAHVVDLAPLEPVRDVGVDPLVAELSHGGTHGALVGGQQVVDPDGVERFEGRKAVGRAHQLLSSVSQRRTWWLCSPNPGGGA
jgi:hypothetical protein